MHLSSPPVVGPVALCSPGSKLIEQVRSKMRTAVGRIRDVLAVKHVFQQESETNSNRAETKGSPQEKTEGSENLSALVSPSSSTTGQSRTRSLNQKRDMPEARTCSLLFHNPWDATREIVTW